MHLVLVYKLFQTFLVLLWALELEEFVHEDARVKRGKRHEAIKVNDEWDEDSLDQLRLVPLPGQVYEDPQYFGFVNGPVAVVLQQHDQVLSVVIDEHPVQVDGLYIDSFH